MKISQLKKGGEKIIPATITDAVVHKEVKTTLTNLINHYNISNLFPKDGGYSLEEAISKINEVLTEDNQKLPGLSISFELQGSDDNTLVTYFYKGGEITSTNSWEEVGYTRLNSIDDRITILEESGVKVEVDSELSLTSENPVQNKIISEQIKIIRDKLFPLSVSVSGGGIFKKGTTQRITISWVSKEGDSIITPDTITINDESIENTETSKIFESVSTNTSYVVKITKSGSVALNTANVKFVNPKYYGVVSSDFIPNPDNVVDFGEIISDSRYYDTTRNLDFQKVCYVYPAVLGKLTKIMDDKNVNYLGSYTLSEITMNGEKYYTYTLTNPTTIVNFKQTYS